MQLGGGHLILAWPSLVKITATHVSAVSASRRCARLAVVLSPELVNQYLTVDADTKLNFFAREGM